MLIKIHLYLFRLLQLVLHPAQASILQQQQLSQIATRLLLPLLEPLIQQPTSISLAPSSLQAFSSSRIFISNTLHGYATPDRYYQSVFQLHKGGRIFYCVSHLPLRPPLGSRRVKKKFFFAKQSRRPTHFHPAQQKKNNDINIRPKISHKRLS